MKDFEKSGPLNAHKDRGGSGNIKINKDSKFDGSLAN